MDLMRFCIDPFAVFPVFSFLGYFPDIYFRIEICCKRFTMVTRVTINNIEIMYFIKMMFCRICGKNGCYPRIESAAQDCSQPGIPIPAGISPLPAVFIFCLIERFVICSIKVGYTCFKTGIHNMKVLVRQCDIYNNIRFV